MKPLFFLTAVLALLLAGCAKAPPETGTTAPETTVPAQIQTETTVPEQTTLPPETLPPHSGLYIPGVSPEDVCLYFREVCLAAEFVNSGDPSVLQRWEVPIVLQFNGSPTEEDLQTLQIFMEQLNTIEGFPGISITNDPMLANLRFHFCDPEELPVLMGPQYDGMDGAVTFWYREDKIYDAIICVRSDLDQQVRNSVILEELYNGFGPVQDTTLREDSIIWQEYSLPQSLTEVDWLILKLLYHPRMVCGMNAEACDAVIRELYY